MHSRAPQLSSALALTLVACGSSAANQLAAETASALLSGAASGSSHVNPDFRAEGAYCEVWKAADRACPVLPDCSRLGSRRLNTNACVRSERLMPVTSCIGDRWNGNQPRQCAGGDFPACSGFVEESCTEFDELVCVEAGGGKRLLECCVGARSDCVSNTYSLAARRKAPSPPKKSRGEAEELEESDDAADGGIDGGEDAP